MEAVRSVRHFRGHRDRITDMAIAQDARWLLSASLDGTVRVWDVPSARCLQVKRLGLEPSPLFFRAAWLPCVGIIGKQQHCIFVYDGGTGKLA